jgi:hypothetical protein
VNRPSAFGETLRRHRESRGVTLDTIARDTKISARLLAALERGDCSHWPRGVYSRAYVRSYACAVGLDPNQVAEEFCQCFADVARLDHEHAPASTASASHGDRPAAPAEPLRLSLDSQRAEGWSPFASRLAAAVPDSLASITLAGIARLAGADFWISLAVVSIGVHALMPADAWRSVPRKVFALRKKPSHSQGMLDELPDAPVVSSVP